MTSDTIASLLAMTCHYRLQAVYLAVVLSTTAVLALLLGGALKSYVDTGRVGLVPTTGVIMQLDMHVSPSADEVRHIHSVSFYTKDYSSVVPGPQVAYKTGTKFHCSSCMYRFYSETRLLSRKLPSMKMIPIDLLLV